ncbi:putative ABC transporter permease protein NosY [Phycisphaerales bacterium]|nr:putative ABC transporter permease protein NosY [Phycisphaerales bacterium]
MITLAVQHAPPRVNTMWRSTGILALRELREAIASRWFLLYTIAFVALGLGVSYVSAAGTGSLGLSGFGRTTAGLINLVLLVVPLMALTAGAGTIASDRERGMLPYLLAQPINRFELLLGKFVGLSLALLACICLGLGGCAAILAWKGETTDPASLVWLAGLSFGLAVCMLSVGMLVSVLARKASVAVGTAVFLWLVLVFVTDLGLMAGALAFRLKIETLFFLCLGNPLQVFKMWTLHEAEASLDVLGPAGLYASDTYGGGLRWMFAGAMAAWTVLPLAAAGILFSRRSPV